VTDAFANYMQALHSMFNDDFITAYNELVPRARRQLLPYLHSIYRRWYYSTFIENIHFSPANITGTASHYCSISANTHTAPVISSPAARVENIDMKVLSYSVESHPIVADFRQLMAICTPHIDLCEEWCFSDAQAMKTAKKLSLHDPYYASFLLEVAGKMNILTRMPSLYVQRMQVSQTASSVLSLPDVDLLNKIVDTILVMTAIGLQNTLPAPIPLFSVEGVRNLLFNPQTTDDIFEQVFESLGYDLNILSLSGVLSELDNFSEEAEAAAELMSGIFVLGVMLDRLFFTPFGYFLRLIRPIYAVPFNIGEEVARYTCAYDEDDDDFAVFFAPCTSYTLTDLGLELFGVEPTEKNYFDSRRILPWEVLDATFISPAGVKSFVQGARESIPVSEMPHAIYTFCIYETNAPGAWAHIQVPKSTTLHLLYKEILDVFCVIESEIYSFFHGKTENPFTEYSCEIDIDKFKKSSSNKRNGKPFNKHSHIPLTMLDFEHIGHMLLVINNFKTQKFTLEWLGESAPNPKEHYPLISKHSAELQRKWDTIDDDDDDDFFDF